MGGINGVFEESQVSLKRNYLLFHFINCLSFQDSETDASEGYMCTTTHFGSGVRF